LQIDGGCRTPNGVVLSNKGELYGTTGSGGGPAQAGTVFELTPPSAPGGVWTETVLYAFQGIPDGLDPILGPVATPAAPTRERAFLHTPFAAVARMRIPLSGHV